MTKSGKSNNKWPQVGQVACDRTSFFWNANKNFRVAGKNKGRSGNPKHKYIFLPYINGFLKARMLTYVVLRGVRNRRFQGKPPTLDGRPLPCHMPIPVLEPGSQL